MPRRKKEKIEGISDKLEYLGLDLDNIPEKFKKFESLEYRVPRFYDEKQYRQYRYIDIELHKNDREGQEIIMEDRD